MSYLFDEQVEDGSELALSVRGIGRVNSQHVHQATGCP